MSLVVPHPLLSDTAPPITLSREQLYEDPELPGPSSIDGTRVGHLSQRQAMELG